MTNITIENGSRQVVISRNEGWSRNDTGGKVWYSARLYVNGGETACLLHWKGKTEKGARQWAWRQLAK
jgi:hypothetical protein